ncbi:kinase-like domain-containing protein [Pisolithus marmoratus]|nr:kinase-like domain-containing protein [Pisolithus marmoratus]
MSPEPDVVSEGPFSLVTRVRASLPDQPTRWIAIKSSTTNQDLAMKPHDIVKEARLIASTCHPNVIPLIKQVAERPQWLSLWMPYVPYSLHDLLSSVLFSPHPRVSFGTADTSVATPREQRFVVLAKSIMFQVLCAVDYLHQTARIAHRDIKPSNVLLTATGCVQLIDFGIAWKQDDDKNTAMRDLWPEQLHDMYFEVSTGAYRAPELLFGPRSYDAFAIDRWSVGVTFAEFFTPIRLRSGEQNDIGTFIGSDSESDVEELPAPPDPFIMTKGVRPTDPTARWVRDNLFEGERGEIVLASSIFKVRGSPNGTNWPSFMQLPDAGKLLFLETNAVDLAPLLPHLPPSLRHAPLDTKTHTPPVEKSPNPLDLVHRFLVYEPSRRLHTHGALRHPWFFAEPGLLLPQDYTSTELEQLEGIKVLANWESKSLGEVIVANLPGHPR